MNYQGLLAELLVPDHPGGLALPDGGLAGLLDIVLAQPDLQVSHVRAAHAEQKCIVEHALT